jgi:hypothetical protein
VGWGVVRSTLVIMRAAVAGSLMDLLRLVDSTPLPCAASRQTVTRSDLAGHAGYGYCASHWRFFWGFWLYLITTAEGMPVIWGLAHPGLGEREVVQALLERDHHLVRAGQVILGDKGFAGRATSKTSSPAAWLRTWSGPTATMNPPGTASSPAAASGSRRSLTPSRASSPGPRASPVRGTQR